MGQVSRFLRKTSDGHAHWCPGCREMHRIPSTWQFNGNVDCPTFSPSVKITGVQTVVDDKGRWTGEWVMGPDGKALPYCCHYFLTNGQLQFCGDCTHSMSGQTVPLPELPEWMQDR